MNETQKQGGDGGQSLDWKGNILERGGGGGMNERCKSRGRWEANVGLEGLISLLVRKSLAVVVEM